jgi:hypothetical protein
MSTASDICAYLKEHGPATRPVLQRELGLGEKTVDSAMRKLLQVGFVIDTGERHKEWHRRWSTVFAVGPIEFDQQVFSTAFGRRGRPSGSLKRETRMTLANSFDALDSAMRGMFGSREAV